MTVAHWCVLVAAVMPYVGTILAKAGGRMSVRANHEPREWLARLDGWKRRANWFQLNGFEAFPAFAAAVILAGQAGALQSSMDQLALAFLGFRIAYLVCYLADLAVLRSLVWIGGLSCVVGLFLLE